MHEYRAFGMHIESELALALPKESRDNPTSDWRVSIGLGRVKSNPSLSQMLGRIHYGELDGDIQVEVPWAGRYRVRGDSRIDVEPAPFIDEQIVALYITGLVLSFLLRRRPFLTLHGSAVLGLNGVLAFLGNRGSGKSTTATALALAGYRIHCDDIIPIASGPVVFPGIPFPKLLPDAYKRLIGDTVSASSGFDGVDKYQVELATSQAPAPLSSIFILEPKDVPSLEILPLRGAAKIAALLPHICSSPGIDDSGELFARSMDWLGPRPVFRIVRPIMGYSIPELIEKIASGDKGEDL